MAGSRMRKKLEARGKKKAAKAAAMMAPGAKSNYAKRQAARRNGAPVADRSSESRPWFAVLLVMPAHRHAPGFAQWLKDFQRMMKR